MPFREWMARCLYDPAFGYYTRPQRPVGRHGDFYTSVSVGSVFGELLAEAAVAAHQRLGGHKPFSLIEQGAHDGSLLADVLGALAKNHPTLASELGITIVEPLAARRAEQAQRLAEPFLDRVHWVDSLADLPTGSLRGFFFCNELLDAFPVDLVRRFGDQWRGLDVALGAEDRFSLVTGALLDPFWQEWLTRHASELPEGATTEICPDLPGWIQELRRVLQSGTALVIDYGREASDYYSSSRPQGTLRGYRAHQRCDDPFAHPGETDLTADVDFTLLREVAASVGFRCTSPMRQELFLTTLATRRLLAFEKSGLDAAARTWLRQFQTLVHPGHLGHSFHVVEMHV